MEIIHVTESSLGKVNLGSILSCFWGHGSITVTLSVSESFVDLTWWPTACDFCLRRNKVFKIKGPWDGTLNENKKQLMHLKHGFTVLNLNIADTNNRLHNILPGQFPCTSSGAYYIVKVTMKNMNKIIIIQNEKNTQHIDILHLHLTL